MKIIIVASAILLASIPSASTAQLEGRERVGSGEIRPGVQIDPSIRPSVRLATNEFGAYISEINGYPGRPIVRRGIRLVIVGQGFGQRHARSFVYFSYPATSGGPDKVAPLLDIRSWSDTRIVAVLSPTLAWPDYTGAVTLKIQGVRPDNFFSSLRLPGVHFIPG